MEPRLKQNKNYLAAKKFYKTFFIKIEHVGKYYWGEVVAANHSVRWVTWHFDVGWSRQCAAYLRYGNVTRQLTRPIL